MVLHPIVGIFFFARTYVRLRLKREWIPEDWLVTASWLCFLAYGGVMDTLMRRHGGEHVWDLTSDQIRAEVSSPFQSRPLCDHCS